MASAEAPAAADQAGGVHDADRENRDPSSGEGSLRKMFLEGASAIGTHRQEHGQGLDYWLRCLCRYCTRPPAQPAATPPCWLGQMLWLLLLLLQPTQAAGRLHQLTVTAAQLPTQPRCADCHSALPQV